MYRFHRTVHVRLGHQREASQWAKEVAVYLSNKYQPHDFQAYSERFGDPSIIHWFVDYEDLATIEKVNAQLLIDQEYLALLAKGTGFLVEGTLRDTLTQSM